LDQRAPAEPRLTPSPRAEQEGLATSRRDGKIVFYSLTDVGADLLDTVLEATAGSKAPIEAAPRAISCSS
jgi:DNA-binding transcriptional ArsR family regulator